MTGATFAVLHDNECKMSCDGIESLPYRERSGYAQEKWPTCSSIAKKLFSCAQRKSMRFACMHYL